jgi:hypothetical protein
MKPGGNEGDKTLTLLAALIFHLSTDHMSGRRKEAFDTPGVWISPAKGLTGNTESSIDVSLFSAFANQIHQRLLLEDRGEMGERWVLLPSPLHSDSRTDRSLQGFRRRWEERFREIMLTGSEWTTGAEQQWLGGFDKDAHYS